MISLFLKHKIFEVSINKFFDLVEDNFKSIPEISIGNKFKSISFGVGYIDTDREVFKTYTQCVITDVYSGIYLDKSVSLFNFTDGTGELVMGCNINDIRFER